MEAKRDVYNSIIATVALAAGGQWTEADKSYGECIRKLKNMRSLPGGDERCSLRWGHLRRQEADCVWQEAQQLFKELLWAARLRLPVRLLDTDVIKIMIALAAALLEQGKVKEAEEVQRAALEKCCQVLVADHPLTLTSMEMLAEIMLQRGSLQRGEEMLRDVRQKCCQVLQADHPLTLKSTHFLALAKLEQGNLQEAEEMLGDVLKKCLQTLGADHPLTLASMSSAGNLMLLRGNLQGAEKMLKDVQQKCCQLLGADHPVTLTSTFSLACVKLEQWNLQEAEQLLGDLRPKCCQMTGTDSVPTLTSMEMLAEIMLARGNFLGAEEMLKDVRQKCCQVLQADHPLTLKSTHFLALAKLGQDKLQEAEEMLGDVLKKCLQTLGADHPLTLLCVNNHANVHLEKCRLQEAEEMLGDVCQVLPAHHPGTLTLTREVEARLQEVVEKKYQVLGADHPLSLMSMIILAQIWKKQGKWQGAEEMLQKVAETNCQVLGADHPLSLMIEYDVALTLTTRWKEDSKFRFCLHNHSLHCQRLETAELCFRRVLLPLRGLAQPFAMVVQVGLAKLLIQSSEVKKVKEARDMLQGVVLRLQEREGGRSYLMRRAMEELASMQLLEGKEDSGGEPSATEPLDTRISENEYATPVTQLSPATLSMLDVRLHAEPEQEGQSERGLDFCETISEQTGMDSE